MHRFFSLALVLFTTTTIAPGKGSHAIQRDNIFNALLGIPENNGYQALADGLLTVTRKSNGNLYVTPQKGLYANQKISCGSFKTVSIKELLELASNQPPLPTAGNGRFNLTIGTSTTYQKPWFDLVDVGALQAKPENCDAVFQVASNFNGLETVHANQNFEKQALMSYVYDLTQGPAASLSALPGLLLRRHLLYYNPRTKPESWGQTLTTQLNFLSAISPNVLTMSQAGYAEFTQTQNRPLPTRNDYENIQIGLHTDIQVIGGQMLSATQQYLVFNPKQRINQVFTAAIDLANTNAIFKNEPAAIAWSQTVIDAAYQGTLLSAIALGKSKVFLTLVGGGAFGNKLSWISNTITRLKKMIMDSGLNATLIWYSYPAAPSAEDVMCKEQLVNLAQETNGNVTLLS